MARSRDRRSLMLFVTPVLVAVFLLLLEHPAPHAIAQDAGTGSATTTTTRADVATTFLADCATCHGADAMGIDGRGPSLQGVGEAMVDYELSTGRMPLDAPGAGP